MRNESSAPIGVFDSGMGGLTVLFALREMLPNEDFVYLGDTARLPYGTKSPTTVERYAQQAVAALEQIGVKFLVIACNTASAFALSALQNAYGGQRVCGVVEPGARAAATVARGRDVAIVATESTIQGGAYQRALTAHGVGKVYGRACPLWVTLAEQGPESSALTQQILQHGLRGLVSRDLGAVLLGCTHFPVFKQNLVDMLGQIDVVDSAQTTAATVARQLESENLANPQAARGSVRYLATDGVDRFVTVGRHFLGDSIQAVELVDL